jgi:murein DD-endopeptidase MepM/ murein hydrolase activator NlpD
MREFKVKGGTYVKQGDLLGVMGATGDATGPHLHLEIRPAGWTSNSLDINEFTQIPNAVGTYEAKESKNKYSEDDTVEMLVQDGVIIKEDVSNWERMLSGKTPLNIETVRALFKEYHNKL